MNLNEFKDIISDFFSASYWTIVLESDILKIRYKDTEKELFLCEQEFNNIYNRLQECKQDNYYELVDEAKFSYETIVIPDSTRHIFDEELSIEDHVNHVEYKYGKASKELMLSMILSKETSSMMRRYRMRAPSAMRYMLESTENMNLIDFLSDMVLRYSSLTITTNSTTPIEKYRMYALAYTYTYMFNRQVSMSLYDNTQISADLPRHIIGNKEFDSPKKFYDAELISYYNEAISSSIPPHRYLSFYHILEFFYERIFSEDQIRKAREIITDVSFSYKRDKDIAKLIKSIQQKSNEKDIALNEKSALSLLIKCHINQSDLKARLIDRNGVEYIKVLNNKVSFSDGNPIIFSNDETQFITSLTERIYKTRNSIVHSKESFVDEKKNRKYKRIRDDQELLQEIALIQAMAEIMINEESKPI